MLLEIQSMQTAKNHQLVMKNKFGKCFNPFYWIF
jgi:hypothetical protein